MSVEIKGYIHTSQEDIDAKTRNVLIGISLGNSFFSKDNLREYILWALQNTKDDVLVLIADKNHAINYEVLSGYSKERGLNVALRKGEEKRFEIETIVSELPDSDKSRVHSAVWETAQNTESYIKNIGTVANEFETNPDFQKHILNIISENLGQPVENLNLEQKKRLAHYVLDELPLLLGGIEYGGKLYNLLPYPGFSSLDFLLEGLTNKTLFPEFAEKLRIDGMLAIVDARVTDN